MFQQTAETFEALDIARARVVGVLDPFVAQPLVGTLHVIVIEERGPDPLPARSAPSEDRHPSEPAQTEEERGDAIDGMVGGMLFYLMRAASLAALTLLGPASAQEPQTVEIETATMAMTLSSQGAVPVAWTIADRADRLALLDPEFVAESGAAPFSLVRNPSLEAWPQHDPRPWQVERSREDGRQVVAFTSPRGVDGLQRVKTYEFAEDGYVFWLRLEVHNLGDAPEVLDVDGMGPGITLGPGLGFGEARHPELFEEGRVNQVLPFFKTEDGVFGVDLPEDEPFAVSYPEESSGLSYGGLHSQYTTCVVIPQSGCDRAVIQLAPGDADGQYAAITLVHPPATIDAGGVWAQDYAIYGGPKDKHELAAANLGLEPIPFHHLWDWLAALCNVLGLVIGGLATALGSWGLALVLFAVAFRLLVLPLSLYGAKNQMLMQAKTEQIKPEIARIKQEIKDMGKRSEAILALQKEHGINPMAQAKGCLPLLIQLPVLIALFQLLLSSNELRGVSFLWIDDLTLTDRIASLGFTLPWLGSYLNLLPVIMLLAHLILARAMIQNSGGKGGAGGYVMPVIMFLLFYPFPAGAMLFWTTGTILQVGENRIATRLVRGQETSP